jgi:DNA polymerase III delta subunit
MATLETLLLYAGERPVTSEDVHMMVRAESSDQMFAFTDTVFARDTAGSLKLLLDEGLDDDSAAKLLSYSGTQSELSLIAASVDRHQNLAALGKELGNVSEGRLARIQKSASKATASAVSQDVAAADRRLKTGKVRGVQSQLFDLLIARARKERDR